MPIGPRDTIQSFKFASPKVAAKKLGRTVEEVLARRAVLGLPDPLSARERRARRRKGKDPND
jgi:hypothetical protein